MRTSCPSIFSIFSIFSSPAGHPALERKKSERRGKNSRKGPRFLFRDEKVLDNEMKQRGKKENPSL